jgi:hypothetical protein
MSINFTTIFNHVVPIENFQSKWRFVEDKNNKLPDQDLSQLKALDEKASKFLYDHYMGSKIHEDEPFKKGYFQKVFSKEIQPENNRETRRWLYERGLPFDKLVFVSWDAKSAMIVPWKLLIKYFDTFYLPSADDLTVIDQSLSWALLFRHYDVVYFGTNNEIDHEGKLAELEFINS